MKKITLFLLSCLLASTMLFAQAKPGAANPLYLLDGTGLLRVPARMHLVDRTVHYLKPDSTRKIVCTSISGKRIVFLDSISKLKSSQADAWPRITLETNLGIGGDFQRITQAINISATDLEKMSSTMKEKLELTLKAKHITMVSWKGVDIQNVNGQQAIHMSYIRQGQGEPQVQVDQYYFENYDRRHSILLSYPLEEAAQWAPIMQEILKSFRAFAR